MFECLRRIVATFAAAAAVASDGRTPAQPPIDPVGVMGSVLAPDGTPANEGTVDLIGDVATVRDRNDAVVAHVEHSGWRLHRRQRRAHIKAPEDVHLSDRNGDKTGTLPSVKVPRRLGIAKRPL